MQDARKSQFLSGEQLVRIQRFPSHKLVTLPRFTNPACATISLKLEESEKKWIHAFPKGIIPKRKADNHFQDSILYIHWLCQYHNLISRI